MSAVEVGEHLARPRRRARRPSRRPPTRARSAGTRPGRRRGHTTFPSTYQTGPCVWTCSVSERARRISTRDRDPLLVEALEAAGDHLGRGAVARPPRGAEAEAEAVGRPGRVERGAEEGRPLHVSVDSKRTSTHASDQSLGSVSSSACQAAAAGLPRRRLDRRGEIRRDERELAADALVVETRERAHDGRRRRARPVPHRGEAERVAGATRRERAQQLGNARAPAVVRDRQREPRLAPAFRELALDRAPLSDQAHRRGTLLRASTLRPWPRSRNEGR